MTGIAGTVFDSSLLRGGNGWSCNLRNNALRCSVKTLRVGHHNLSFCAGILRSPAGKADFNSGSYDLGRGQDIL